MEFCRKNAQKRSKMKSIKELGSDRRKNLNCNKVIKLLQQTLLLRTGDIGV